MTRPERLICEEPIRPNPFVTSLDEASQRLVLAEFSIESVCRYTLVWERGAAAFPDDAITALASLADVVALPMHLVIGWRQDESGHQRGRHRNLVAALRKTGWEVRADIGLGLGVLATDSVKLAGVHETVRNRGVGWCLILGDGLKLDGLFAAPFRKTMEFFCWNHRLAPSSQFIRGLGDCGSAIGYCVSGDDRLPAVYLLSRERLCGAIARELQIKEPH